MSKEQALGLLSHIQHETGWSNVSIKEIACGWVVLLVRGAAPDVIIWDERNWLDYLVLHPDVFTRSARNEVRV